MFRIYVVIFYFLLATHFIGCSWLFVARIDPDSATAGWFKLAQFETLNPTQFEKYIEGLFFVVATMTGLGYGNIYPTSNLEWAVDSVIMATGASIYAKFFADFAVEIYMKNRQQIDN